MSSPPSPAPLRLARRLLLTLLLVSLIPALLLGWSRVRYEQNSRTVAIVMDYAALVSQARGLGRDSGELLAEYRALGVNGVALMEETVQTRIARGEIIARTGAELYADFPGKGFDPSWTYLRSVQPGAAEAIRERYVYRTRNVELEGKQWIGWPVDITGLAAGPNIRLIDSLKAGGFQVVYRPYDSTAARDVASDWPDVPFIAFNGLKVVGADSPERLKLVDERLGARVPAIIEMNPQKGMAALIENRPAIRMFSIRPEWQELLRPDELASKFVLAARERSHRLLFVRPFQTVDDTRDFLTRVKGGLDRADISIGAPAVADYSPNGTLRVLSLFGPLIALALLALSYPLTRLGMLIALGTVALVVVVNLKSPLGAGALLAAVVFPALGFVMRRHRPTDWLIATGFSLMGVAFVAALGADRLSMLGLDPFRGVSLTLIMPLGLFALSLLPRQDIRKTLSDLYHYPLRLGDVAIIVVALAAIALMVLRRGNTPAVGVSDAETRVRALLQDNLIRPRFKEIVGHPLAILGLSGRLPPYFTSLLLMGGVVAQASVLNTFAHFHTPLLISLQRVVNGVAIGGLIGFVLLPLLAWGIKVMRGGPKSADTLRPPTRSQAVKGTD
ncbi:hypothetical protein Deipe_0839 [Deinococcus peraridilitoris DSM 19664]|uniref:Uncharacterized protein n=1 Tax=Deinococcus peraridilitoris (strain DSM 19664 / LMG 22246 / CIP 109416 / KR-200) TaxID=937777 RepID=K9ZXL9_DEIPD|nr:hypothetical protein Deipe_0839 [Deinococcus peraridilitoris DSM 19664]